MGGFFPAPLSSKIQFPLPWGRPWVPVADQGCRHPPFLLSQPEKAKCRGVRSARGAESQALACSSLRCVLRIARCSAGGWVTAA